jgi:hypothetical protein
MASARLLQAPANRAVGRRGWRAPAACVVAIAGLPALAFSTYSDPPGWTGAAFLFASVALISAAVLLWTAQQRAGLGIAAVLVAAAVAASLLAEAAQRREQREADRWGGSVFNFDDQGPTITEAQAQAVPDGSTKDEVRSILGQAAGSGVQRVTDGRDMRCLAYRASDRRGPGARLYAFCFSGGRYSALRRW